MRVQGTITQHPDGTSSLEDGTGSIRVSIDEMTRPGVRIDLLGFVVRTGKIAALEDAIARPVDGRTSPSEGTANAGSLDGIARLPLATIKDVRELPPGEARRGLPVRLRAVVTYWMKPRNFVFIQDATAGIFMVNTGPPVEPGQLVDVAGETGAGDFAPIVDKGEARVIGQGRMPDPIRVAAAELFTGRYDSQWVEVEGIVQNVVREETDAFLSIVSGTHRFRIVVPGLGDRLPVHLVDTKIKVRGACGSIFNERRQLLSVQVFAPGLELRDRARAFSCRPAVAARSADQHAAAIHPRTNQRPPRQSPGHRHAATPERGHLHHGCHGRSRSSRRSRFFR